MNPSPFLPSPEPAAERAGESAAEPAVEHLRLAVALGDILYWRAPLQKEQAVQFNERALQMLGLHTHRGHTTRQHLRQAIHPDDLGAFQANTNLALSLGKPVDMVVRFAVPEGGWRQILTRRMVQRSDEGVPLAILGVGLDITERLQRDEEAARLAQRMQTTTQALSAAQERAVLVANTVGLGSWEIDLRTRQVQWDEPMWTLRGLPPGPRHPPAEQIYAGVHADDVDMLRQQLRLAIQGKATAYYEFRCQWPDGQWRWLASRSVPVRDEAGHVVGRLGLNWDVTEARQAGIARQQKDAAERESRAKSQFLARMSHELRTPLNAVLGFTQMLQADGERVSVETRKRRLEHIRSAGQHLLSLINDVLDLSSLESGEVRVQLAPVALQPLLADTLPLVDRLARQRKVKVRAGVLDGEVMADATRLRQVLLNLLTNAIKYNREGGSVTVESETRGGWTWLRVSDTGLGMDDEQMLHVFEPFNRLGRELQNSDGTGIGLAIVKALVERMGGSVHVDSTPGVGSLFELRLRGADPSEPRATVAAPRSGVVTGRVPTRAGAGHQASLLYIEDNIVNALIVQELISRRTDLSLRCAVDGTQGVQMALEDPPDLVLVDMQLPDFDGLEVLRRLRADARTAAIPCIAVSANALRHDIDTALEAGFAEYWTKPLDFAFFFQSLDRLFGPAPPVQPTPAE